MDLPRDVAEPGRQSGRVLVGIEQLVDECGELPCERVVPVLIPVSVLVSSASILDR